VVHRREGPARPAAMLLMVLLTALVGALFGGASPLTAARFQLVVLVGLLAAESVAAVVLRLLAAVPFLPIAAAER
jgi:UDP-glucose/iron transport system permease protein